MRNSPPPLGPPQDPRSSLTVGSYGVAVSYERGTPAGKKQEPRTCRGSNLTLSLLEKGSIRRTCRGSNLTPSPLRGYASPQRVCSSRTYKGVKGDSMRTGEHRLLTK